MLACFRRLVDGPVPPYRREQPEHFGRRQMTFRRALTALGAAVLLMGAAASHVRAEEPFYKGKRLTVLVNFAAGGPADIESRIFAKYLVKHIEGQPALIVQN